MGNEHALRRFRQILFFILIILFIFLYPSAAVIEDSRTVGEESRRDYFTLFFDSCSEKVEQIILNPEHSSPPKLQAGDQDARSVEEVIPTFDAYLGKLFRQNVTP